MRPVDPPHDEEVGPEAAPAATPHGVVHGLGSPLAVRTLGPFGPVVVRLLGAVRALPWSAFLGLFGPLVVRILGGWLFGPLVVRTLGVVRGGDADAGTATRTGVIKAPAERQPPAGQRVQPQPGEPLHLPP